MTTRTPQAQTRNSYHRDWGNYASGDVLPNTSGFTSPISDLQPLEAGDRAYVDGRGVWFCSDPGTPGLGDALWQPVATLRRSYGSTTIMFPNSPYPLDIPTAQFCSTASGGNVDLITYFDSIYFRCLVSVRIVDGGQVQVAETTRRFTDLAAVVAWVNAQVPSSGYVATMEVVDVVDTSLSPPPKVYGKNRTWAGLLGRANRGAYWTPDRHSCGNALNPPGAAPNRAQLLWTMWSDLFPLFPLPAPLTWSSQEFSCSWLTSRKQTLYECPKFDAAFELNAGNSGQRWQWDGTNLSPAPAGGAWAWDATAAQPIIYGVLDAAGSFAVTFNIKQAPSYIPVAVLRGESVVVGYPIRSTADPTQMAMFIKPIGIDQIFFDPFDDTRFQMEAVGWGARDRRPKIRILSMTQAPAQQRNAGPVSVQQFAEAMLPSALSRSVIGRMAHGARFQLRDLSTNLVTPLTDARVTRRVARARPWSLVVENEQSV